MPDPRLELNRLKSLLQAGKALEARPVLARVVQSDPRNAEAAFLLAIAHIAVGANAEAVPLLQKLAQVAPQVPDVHNNLGIALKNLGREDEAERSFRNALARNAGYAEAHANLAHLLLRTRRPEEASRHFLRTLQLNPAFTDALRGLADSLRMLGRSSESRQALEAYCQAVPADADAANALGVAEQALGNLAAAEQAFRRALAAKPGHSEAASNLGAILLQQNKVNDALACAELAAKNQPGSADAANNLALVHLRLNQPGKALGELQRALSLSPTHSDARHNLANALHAQGRTAEAIAVLEQVLVEKPDFASARFNLANMRLLTGDFALGWADYEARPTRRLRAFPKPDWDGNTSLAGHTLLVYAEQGLGDTLNFARYLPLLAEKGATVVLEAQVPLLPVLEPLRSCCTLVGRGDTLPPFDYVLPLLSAPLVCGTRADSIPSPGPWVGVSEEKLQAWRARLRGKGTRRLGLVWAGNPAHTNDHNRSLPLARLLAAIPGKTSLFSLQKEIPASDTAALAATPDMQLLSPFLNDFSDTAAALLCLDALVTVDTSVAHLAGCLGVPTFLLLPTPPDWRWLLGRDDSPWYPTVRLFRQPAPGDWAPALARLHSALHTSTHA
ncbi:MAG: tetratricopeptide repeat protein [Opitutaceae bacterium]|nr:tetratricopeptide repeat protein [Opitutaceae bacterium]